jgi:bifunctional NMN adenylyltransferase/nudix hydrolase
MIMYSIADLRKQEENSELIRVTIEPNIDTIYDDNAWIERVQSIVSNYCKEDSEIVLIGYSKDGDTSRYLNMFPQWARHNTTHTDILDATKIREMYFNPNMHRGFIAGVVPGAVMEFLDEFDADTYDSIVEEKKFIDNYIKKKEVYEYPIVGVTCDAVVVQAGHVLLIRRRSIPGKGLWALPGGYFDANRDRDPVDGIFRELREETKIDVPDKVLRGSLDRVQHFAAPGRSLLGRSVTFAGFIRLSDGEWNLPRVRGSDDAEKAKWFPISQIKRDFLFDDHFDIIQHFIPAIKG